MSKPLFVLYWEWPDGSGCKVIDLIFTQDQKEIMDHAFKEMPGTDFDLVWQEVQFPKGGNDE